MNGLRNKLKENKGYVILEAAILTPVFLFAVVLLVYILQVLHFQEIIHFEACRNLAELSWESQLGAAGLEEALTAPAQTQEQKDAKIARVKALYESVGVPAAAREEIARLSRQAISCAEGARMEEEGFQMLRRFADALVGRMS